MDITHLLNAHIDRFNSSVLSGGFDEMVAHFTEDAVMSFEGVPVGPFRGRDQIAAAYRAQPPDDQLVLVEVLEKGTDFIEVSYAWAIAPDRRAGTMAIERRGDLIARLIVRFE
ncbi:MAG: nuclear transport factor 2 family protein [Acidimicrobiia bacterium]